MFIIATYTVYYINPPYILPLVIRSPSCHAALTFENRRGPIYKAMYDPRLDTLPSIVHLTQQSQHNEGMF